MSRDGGLIDAILDHLQPLTGYAEKGRDFCETEEFPRLVVSTGANHITLRTNKTEHRKLDVSFEIVANSGEQLQMQGELLDAALDELAENSSIVSALMPSGAGVREMDITNQSATQEDPKLWRHVVSTEWDIGITRN